MTTDAPTIIALRGQPRALAQRPSLRSPDGVATPRRADRTVKGPGFFGEVYNTHDRELFTTEASYHLLVRVPKRTHGRLRHRVQLRLCPLLVPGLSREAIAHLVDGGDPTMEILETAAHWAEQRIAGGQSPFAGWDEPAYEIPAGGQ